MKLITEVVEDVDIFELEEEDGKKTLHLEGVFLQSQVKNRNGRVYPKEILQREVARYKKDYIKENRAFGELGHPDGPVINLERVSHLITELTPNGNNWMGKAKITTHTPYGKIVEGLLKDGARLGVSSRGMGSLEEHKYGTKIVKDDFHLATAADIVADPSAPNAFVQGVMEGREWIWENGALKETDLIKHKKELDTPKHIREERMLKEFKQFLSKL